MAVEPLVPMVSIEEGMEIAKKAGLRPEMANINFYRVLLNAPMTGRVEAEINDRILWEGELTKRPAATRMRELAIMRLAWASKTEYQWAHHFSPTVDKGIPGMHPEDILVTRLEIDDPSLGDAERAIFHAVAEMLDQDYISEDTVHALRANLESDAELTELIYCIAIWRAISTLMKTFRIPLEEGYVPWAPDGKQP